MGFITPTQSSKQYNNSLAPRPSFADQKRWISNEFYQALNEFTELDDGSRMTKIQAAVRSTVDSMLDPESDPYYRLAALKFITEHIEGKAAAMKDEVKEEMPKFAIIIGDAKADKIAEAVNTMNPAAEPTDGILAEISDEDGSDKQELVV